MGPRSSLCRHLARKYNATRAGIKRGVGNPVCPVGKSDAGMCGSLSGLSTTLYGLTSGSELRSSSA